MFLPVTLPVEMNAWDKRTMDFGLSGLVLMENAARQAFSCLRHACGNLAGKTALLLAGAGNNGGDAFCLARLLLDAGVKPLLACTRPQDQYGGDSAHNLALARQLDIEFISLDQIQKLSPDLVIDGMLGTGFTGSLHQLELDLVHSVNTLASKSFILALDIPSGLNAVNGHPCPDAIRADLTISFQAAKPGLLMPHAKPFIGELTIAPIGVPKRIQALDPASGRLWSAERQFDDMDRYRLDDILLPNEKPDPARLRPKHKGQAGKVLILGGGAGLSGAIQLAGRAAFRAGAGLVCLGGPAQAFANSPPSSEFIRLALDSGQDGREWPTSLPRCLYKEINSYKAVLIGPGMGRLNGAVEFLRSFLELAERPPLILDADALTALYGRDDLLAMLRPDDILTPHPGEAASLLGLDPAAVQADRLAALAGLAAKARAIWILKGECSLIHVPGQPVTFCPYLAPNLAVAGSGDVLAGLISALRAAGLNAQGAAIAGVYAHGLAGLLLAREFPNRGNLPQEIADCLPCALSRLALDDFYPYAAGNPA